MLANVYGGTAAALLMVQAACERSSSEWWNLARSSLPPITSVGRFRLCSDMKINFLITLALPGILMFLFMLLIFVVMAPFYPPLLVTPEFAKLLHPFGLVMSTYVGFSLIFVHFVVNILPVSRSFSKKKLFDNIKKHKWILVGVVFSSLLIGYLTYGMIINIPASLLHQNAPKEDVQFQAIATSAWPARRDLRKNCQHHLLFTAPEISPNVQFVCITTDQWLYFTSAEYPITITLRGKKSYYGYELRLSDYK